MQTLKFSKHSEVAHGFPSLDKPPRKTTQNTSHNLLITQHAFISETWEAIFKQLAAQHGWEAADPAMYLETQTFTLAPD